MSLKWIEVSSSKQCDGDLKSRGISEISSMEVRRKYAYLVAEALTKLKFYPTWQFFCTNRRVVYVASDVNRPNHFVVTSILCSLKT